MFHIVWKLLKKSHLNFGIFHQFLSYEFWQSGNTVWMQVFLKLRKMDHFWHFNELLSTQNINVACSAHNVECDFSVIFKHRGITRNANILQPFDYFLVCIPQNHRRDHAAEGQTCFGNRIGNSMVGGHTFIQRSQKSHYTRY